MGAGASAPAGSATDRTPKGGALAQATTQGGKGGNPTASAPVTPATDPYAGYLANVNGTTAGTPPATPPVTPSVSPVTPSVSPVAPTAPQQPYVNPYMQTYGQNNTPQQQAFNRFPQRFQQPQPVAQPAQGPVYADQSLNAPGNQPQRFQQPQYGRFGRGFMPQNRGGYERQMDQLRGQGQYGQQQMPSLRGQQIPYSSSMDAGMGDPRGYANNSLLSGQQQMPAYNGPTQAQWGQMQNQPVTSYEARPSFGESQQTGVSQLNPFQAALVKGGTPYVQGAPGAPYAIGQGIPGGAPGGYMPLMNSNGTPVSSLASANPAGGKGGNPTSKQVARVEPQRLMSQ